VAAAELAVMAGADRVEGCLFGNGERTGNVDLVTLGMNLFSQGIDPQIDFSDIDEIRRMVEYCNQIPLHPRHPYAGDLVYTSFSGSHQDAIKKGFDAAAVRAEAAGMPMDQTPWAIPYLPIDPHDVGRTYEAVIRVNSQSGKGGMAYLLKAERSLEPPRRLLIEFARVVQRRTDRSGAEITAQELCAIFEEEYIDVPGRRLSLLGLHEHVRHDGTETVHAEVRLGEETCEIHGTGNDLVSAFAAALATAAVHVQVLEHAQHAAADDGGQRAVAYAECVLTEDDETATAWGVATGEDRTLATLRAICAAVNRTAAGIPRMPRSSLARTGQGSGQ
jgi:2-isopropylmalate synthase